MVSKNTLFLVLVSLLFSCSNKKDGLFDMDNLYPWCIVPFDAKKRTPEARIQMLSELGFQQYAYDWRKEHLPEMTREWSLAEDKGIQVRAVYIWIDDRWDKVGQLNESNEQLLKNLKLAKLETQIWVAFHPNFVEGLKDKEALNKSSKMIYYLCERASDLNCKIALYNHGDWLGEPLNQIRIIKALPKFDLGLIYNFHHSYDQVEYYPEFIGEIIPYLWSVNLSGVQKGTKDIIDLGNGDHEKEMLHLLIQNGYKNAFGILGHRRDEDVKEVLKRNLKGLSIIK
ncbi:MAG: AP endonuclease [Bacteroidota bacterium]